jgi:hypothetical protein
VDPSPRVLFIVHDAFVADIARDLLDRFRRAVETMDERFRGDRLANENADRELRRWLDGDEEPLSWTDPAQVTEDEWFFISTLYGEMTLSSQRAHIRKFFPSLFVGAAARDIRRFVPGMESYQGLRSAWMSKRLCRMGEILRDRRIDMAEYAARLRRLDLLASPDNPVPALDAIVRDHRAEGWKTLSVFVRDCVQGNCFPIDSRVQKELGRWRLPADERLLVRMSLVLERDPRVFARMFYEAGGEP